MTYPESWTAQRRLAIALHLAVLALLGVHLYARTLPATPTPLPSAGDAERAWWGVWPVTYVPAWALAGGVLAMLAAIGWGWWQLGFTPLDRNAWREWRLPPSVLIALAAILFCAFFAWPIVHTRWGDAYILTNAISWPDPAQRLTHSWQAPLDVFLHSQVWLRFHDSLGWTDATPVYRLLSPLAGAVYLLVVLLLSWDDAIGSDWFTFVLLSSIGTIQLFFGYVENYSYAAAGVLAYLWLGLRSVRDESPLWLAATVLAITNATHPSTVVLAPSLLYCGWRRWAGRKRLATGAKIAAAIGLPMLFVAAGTILLMEGGGHGLQALVGSDRPGGGDGRWLVPLFQTTTRWEHYTMFSWWHLRDFLNEQALVAPVVLPALLIAGLGARFLIGAKPVWRTGHDSPSAGLFLLIGAICYLFFTWIWNPDYGGQRDWDLFSLAAIPTALLLAWYLPKILPDRHIFRAAAVPLVLLQVLHTIAWIYQNRLPWQWPS